jgi:cytochrome o ubiquinol oxidase subunit 1
MNLLGKLSWDAIPLDQPIVMAASAGMVVAIVLILGWITLKGFRPYLWRKWITSVDHKRIGVMYIVAAWRAHSRHARHKPLLRNGAQSGS